MNDRNVADPVNPTHYSDGAWQLCERLGFNRGNAVKYLERAGKKDPTKEVEDLRKAIRYIEREIENLERASASGDSQ